MPEPQPDTDRDRGLTALLVTVWIPVVLLAAQGTWPVGEVARQLVLGGATWALLVAVLARRPVEVRVQTAVVVVLATLVEYTFSPLLEAYVYRIGTVPAYVPPGHGLVYLGAWSLARWPPVRRHARVAVRLTVVVGGAWALWAAFGTARGDLLGLFWFGCLLGFVRWGRSTLLYVGAFVVVGYLELVGTHLGTWTWAPTDPVLHVISQGNPPSGAAGGYGWFDLWAQLWTPWLLRHGTRAVARVRAARPRLRPAPRPGP